MFSKKVEKSQKTCYNLNNTAKEPRLQGQSRLNRFCVVKFQVYFNIIRRLIQSYNTIIRYVAVAYLIVREEDFNMEKYKNLSGKSSIDSFEEKTDGIIVMFDTGKIYSYSYAKAGVYHVENMKRLAQSGSGLNSYIMKYVKKLYD